MSRKYYFSKSIFFDQDFEPKRLRNISQEEKVKKPCSTWSLTSLGSVTAQAATRSYVPSPSRSGSLRGRETLTRGMW